MNGIDKPVFILGSGRSGTTLVYRLMGLHPDLCWFSALTDMYPEFPFLASSDRLRDVPVLGTAIRSAVLRADTKFRLYPSEGENTYRLCRFDDARLMTARDSGAVDAELFGNIIWAHLRYSGRSRFLNKRTANTQRIGLINALFPDALFIHVIRDGRAVVNSLLATGWWDSTPLWWNRGRTPRDLVRSRKDLLLIAAEHWMRNVRAIRGMRRLLGNRYMEIRYELFVSDPVRSMERLLAFVRLPAGPYLKTLPERLPDMNGKWKSQLSGGERRLLEKSVRPMLDSLGYHG